jgi:activator of 2-hydroxyglutaryl-CoA dehydratase/predicted nucleotide-binding protein (sugar kinase/HSP70/actin superfamily)
MPGHSPDRTPYLVGIDVGSTTLKGLVSDRTGQVLFRSYQRHESRQAARLLAFLEHVRRDLDIRDEDCRVFMTGSGSTSLAPLIGARFVQEVAAVALAVERLHPTVRSIVELGGQDAKIIVFRDDPITGRRNKFSSMNDKCAGGTGAIIDKIAAKLTIPPADVARCAYTGIRLHQVAGKCGVFAETDINGLQKQGVPSDELMASLFDAIVLQNLTVLARGHTLLPDLLLLGGPTTFIPGLREAWRAHLAVLWSERGVPLPDDATAETLVYAPAEAEYYGAMGAIEFGRTEDHEHAAFRGVASLERELEADRPARRRGAARAGLVESDAELREFRARFTPPSFTPAVFRRGQPVRGFIGLDGGSTSTKAVVLGEDGRVLCKAYQLSNGNPIQDTIALFARLRDQIEGRGAALEVLGVATTGYAKDLLKGVLGADVALVETVAHAESALAVYDRPDVIVDVGGQDIKLIVLSDGRVKDFKLNTQCSAGNGYFLQSTAESFGVPVERYADVAFSARAMPVFGYGCAVFLQSDVVNCQRLGWRPEEILAGLAAVLPKNIWLYVARVPNLASLGSRFVLQGGTQNNLAAVKAQVDFIRARFAGSGVEPEIRVHPHCGECGAIGAALEARRQWRAGRLTTFVGLDAVQQITYTTIRNEDTRCYFCTNRCVRTFIDVKYGGLVAAESYGPTKVPLAPGAHRLILASCEKGAVEDVGRMRAIKADVDAVKRACPNLVDLAAHAVWKPRTPPRVADAVPARAWTPRTAARIALMRNRERLMVGIPRVLNMFWYTPLFRAYLESLGVAPEHIVCSDFTNDDAYRAGSARGAIDPCFPSKVVIAHIHDLMFGRRGRTPLDCIFLPMFDYLTTPLAGVIAPNACPTATCTPEVVKAAFTKEGDLFAANGIRLLTPLLDLWRRPVFAGQMFETWRPILGLSCEENERAVAAAFAAQEHFERDLRQRARQALAALEREGRLGIVVLGRAYHHDPGINHGIFDELQKHGYTIFSQSTLPLDRDLLDRLFGAELTAGAIADPLEVSDVWKNTISASSCLKLWAAKFTARHPNLIALEVSSFKCGHDAPIYSVVQEIIERSATPYFAFKDLDENRPAGAIRIRVETMDYFLRRFVEERSQGLAAGQGSARESTAATPPHAESEGLSSTKCAGMS